MGEPSYKTRTAAEVASYENCRTVHDLPPIFHYWSETHIRPKLAAFGFQSPNDIFQQCFREQIDREASDARFLSIGSGNCDVEIEIARNLRSKGYGGFVIDCLELNPAMLKRGRRAAVAAGVGDQVHAVEGDFNEWAPCERYAGVMANQSLHHVVKLESLFARVKGALRPGGCFAISDIIGRNGHQRWPEALNIVREYWRKLPPAYRINRQLHRYEEIYENEACPANNFEGVRAQDILKLLIENFHFRLFIGFANIIEPFVDRSFGPNFDSEAEWDRAFIDRVHRRDVSEMAAGRVKPTHMLAVVGSEAGTATLFEPPFSPDFCVRDPGDEGNASPVGDAYELEAWPPSSLREIELGRQLGLAEHRMRAMAEALKQRDVPAFRWALRLDRGVRRAVRRFRQ